MKTLILLILTSLSVATQLHAQSAFRSRASGNWNNMLTWEKWNGTAWVSPSSSTDYPGATDSVYIQALHTVTLTQSESCRNLNLNNTLGVKLQLNDYNLLVSGRISLFGGNADFPVLYTNLNLGASVNNGANNLGNVRVVGYTRTVFRAAEWATNFTTLNLEIVLIDNSQVAGVEMDLTLARLNLLSGDFDVDGNLFMDDSSMGGDIFIGAATLLSVGKSILRNGLGAPADSIIVNGTLQLSAVDAGQRLLADAVILNAGAVLDMNNTVPLLFDVTHYVVNVASALLYSGNVLKQPVGDEFPRNGIRKLIINTTGSVELNTGKNVSDTLLMIAGDINIPLGDSLSLGVNARAVLQHTSGSVIGKINRFIPALSTNVMLFPVGSEDHYRPVNIDFTGASIVSGNISVEHVSDTGGVDIPGFNDGSFLINRRSNMYWDIGVNAGLSADNISINAGVDGQTGITDSSQLRLIGSTDNGVNLSLLGGVTVPLLSNLLGLLGLDLDSNNLRLYLGGNVNINPLPVKLSEFSASYLKNEVEVRWQTVSENNNDYFEVQRSADGKNFISISAVKGTNQAVIANYVYVDYSPFSGTNYYRLAQYDYNKSVSYSQIVRLDATVNPTNATLAVGPNPVDDVLNIQFDNNAYTCIRVIDMLGQNRMVKNLNTDITGLSVDMTVLNRGTYLLQFMNGDKVIETKRIVKQ